MPKDHLRQDQHNQKKELKQCNYTDVIKEDQAYYDSNSNNDTFHDAIQAENTIDDTYGDDDDVNKRPINNNDRKPINNEFLQPVGQQEGATGMMYVHEALLYVQYSMQDPLDHLDSISSKPDPYSNKQLLDPLDNISSIQDLYSNKQWNQSNHHEYSKQDLHGPSKHLYNRKSYHGDQRLLFKKTYHGE